jgi:DNA-binding NtrC family response regulator
MNHWQMIPELAGHDAHLRRAVQQTMDVIVNGNHLLIEGEAGTGRRTLARSCWRRASSGNRPLFTLDCHTFSAEVTGEFLFGARSRYGAMLHDGGFHLAMSTGLLLLHIDELAASVQGRLAEALDSNLRHQHGTTAQLILTCDRALDSAPSLEPSLLRFLRRVRMPSLRERRADIELIAEAFLRKARPYSSIRCSPALIERLCMHDWPGNVTELRSVLRRLLLEPHGDLLDVHHLDKLMSDEDAYITPMPEIASAGVIPELCLSAPQEGRSAQ